MRTSYLSGRPYTAYDATLSTQQRRAIFQLSEINALRLPAYFRLDLRLDRTFYLKQRTVLVFLGVQNITGRRNVAGISVESARE